MTRLLKAILQFTLAGALMLAGLPACLSSQAAPPGAIAWTQCLDNKVESFINVGVLGTDSAAVILRHEEIHRRQQIDTIAKTGHCIVYIYPYQLLNAEIEAYCASDSLAVKLGADPVETSAASLLRMMQMLHRVMPVFTISDSWARGCPGKTHRE